MTSLGLWSIEENGPRRLSRGNVGLEHHLEAWIESDPALVREGLTIVGRQMNVEGGRLDLLGIDMQGRWVLIEIKGGRLNRETVAQALDYASCIAEMPFAELSHRADEYLQSRGASFSALMAQLQMDEEANGPREIQVYIVGTGVAPGLQRIVRFLSDGYKMPIGIVSFDVFETSPARHILMRELDEREMTAVATPQPRLEVSAEKVLAEARQHGTEPAFQLCLAAARRNDLYPRIFKSSIMFTPPANRTRCLFTIWTKPFGDGRIKIFVASEVFTEFYEISEDRVIRALGPSGWRQLTIEEIDAFTQDVDRLFAMLQPAHRTDGELGSSMTSTSHE